MISQKEDYCWYSRRSYWLLKFPYCKSDKQLLLANIVFFLIFLQLLGRVLLPWWSLVFQRHEKPRAWRGWRKPINKEAKYHLAPYGNQDNCWHSSDHLCRTFSCRQSNDQLPQMVDHDNQSQALIRWVLGFELSSFWKRGFRGVSPPTPSRSQPFWWTPLHSPGAEPTKFWWASGA